MNTNNMKESQILNQSKSQSECRGGGNLFSNGKIERYVFIPGLDVEHLFRVNIQNIHLWIIDTLAPLERAVIKVMTFLKNRNSRTKRLPEYVLLATRKGKRTTYRYLTSGMNPTPFREYYGRVIPTMEELIRTFPNSKDLMDWLEERLGH